MLSAQGCEAAQSSSAKRVELAQVEMSSEGDKMLIGLSDSLLNLFEGRGGGVADRSVLLIRYEVFQSIAYPWESLSGFESVNDN